MHSTSERASDAVLLDANVLIAASFEGHEHHTLAREWLSGIPLFSTCPSTQGSLLRFIIRVSSTDHAIDALRLLADNDRHEFWPDDQPYDPDLLRDVMGHRQVTHVYLAGLAAGRRSRLATLDRGLSLLRPEVVELIT